MVDWSAEQFAQHAVELGLLDQRQLQDVWTQFRGRQVSGDEFRQVLLRRELLTNYQVERMLRGDRHGYFYGDYKVLYFVGSGTFARVYRAAHKTTGQIVALKVLRGKHSEEKEQVERFVREGQMVTELRHPNIVPIYEVFSKGRTHYLVMEFIEGRNLREFMKIRKKFAPPDATRLIADVAAGLAYAFERGIHHRDLKLSNILVSSRGQAKLVDFGLAAADPDEAEDEEGVVNPRTIDYAGLERATGVRKDDPRSDIYFLGCIFYHLLTGVPPLYETKDRMLRLSKTRFETVPSILSVAPDLPKSLALIVSKAMALDPEQRYQSPADMHTELKAAALRMAEQDGAAGGDGAKVVQQRVVLLVESNPELQNVFRERLKSSGYRVLVTQDPQRALARLREEARAADCAIFSTGELGRSALEAFNQLADSPSTAQLPAILLLDEGQKAWQAEARLGEQRVAISMPIKLRELRQVLARLAPVESPA